MKITTLFFSVVFLFTTQVMLSQDTITKKEEPCVPGSTEYTTRYVKLKALYDKMLTSDASKEFIALNHSFSAKAGFEGRVDEQRSKFLQEGRGVINDWVFNNIEKTGFKNCEEAEAQVQKIAEVNFQVVQENKELYIYMGESLEICRDISRELLRELMIEYGDDFRF